MGDYWSCFGCRNPIFFSASNFGNPYLAYFQKLYSNYFVGDAEGTKSAKDFTADFSITLGTHTSGVSLLVALLEGECDVSPWSREALGNPSFPVVAAETTIDIVVVSMLELGFAADEFATIDAIYARAKQMGFETCPVETAPQLRLQFRDQPDLTTGKRLGDFFVASEPFVLTRDGFPKIFSVLRDDDFPHPETGIGLWLISNDTVESEIGDTPTDCLMHPILMTTTVVLHSFFREK